MTEGRTTPAQDRPAHPREPGGGEAGPTASPAPGRRGLRDLALAILAGAVLWGFDSVTGRHLQGGLTRFAGRLDRWYDENRQPVVRCWPREATTYTALSGTQFEVPSCWKTEVVELLGEAQHRFWDPDLRAGVLTVTSETAEDADGRASVEGDFDRLAAKPDSIVIETDGSVRGRESARWSGPTEAGRVATPQIPDSPAAKLVERLAQDEHTDTSARPGKERGPSTFRIVEAVTDLGPSEELEEVPGSPPISTLPPDDADRPRIAWSWLAVSGDRAVRLVYTVREDRAAYELVQEELRSVRDIVRSLRIAPAPS